MTLRLILRTIRCWENWPLVNNLGPGVANHGETSKKASGATTYVLCLEASNRSFPGLKPYSLSLKRLTSRRKGSARQAHGTVGRESSQVF
jgi:hypothetical protein